jgi:signal recognition particle subunit SRP54
MLVGIAGFRQDNNSRFKLALYLRRQGQRPLMVAADTHRPAAVEQLVTLGRQLGIEVYSEGATSRPPDIAYNGVQAAIRANASVVIIDTAGRLQIDDEMMAEVAAIQQRVRPKEVLW